MRDFLNGLSKQERALILIAVVLVFGAIYTRLTGRDFNTDAQEAAETIKQTKEAADALTKATGL